MRIMTYNIQSGRNAFGQYDLSQTIEAIRALNPDILGLNEVRMRTKDINYAEQASLIASALHMHFYFAKAIDHMEGEYGVALLSKYPITEASAIPVPPLPAEKRERRYEDRVLLKAGVLTPGGKISVYVSHFGLSEAERQNAASLVIETLKKEKDPAIFMGDLNMTPDETLIREIKKVIRDASDENAPNTFHALSLRQKIDYIFLSPEFTILNMLYPHTTASDHIPIIATVSLGGPHG